MSKDSFCHECERVIHELIYSHQFIQMIDKSGILLEISLLNRKLGIKHIEVSNKFNTTLNLDRLKIVFVIGESWPLTGKLLSDQRFV